MTGEGTPRRILVFGASGTIGRACVNELARRGNEVLAFVRPSSSDTSQLAAACAEVRCGQITDSRSVADDAFRGERFDAVISCIASRSGAPDDAWRIDCKANSDILKAAKVAGVRHMILLSAICVQRPKLAFQHAKLAFEEELQASGLTYSIVRPTAFFKSLSGQIERVRSGKPFLLFGDGRLTSCKPISDSDLARYIADCLDQTDRHNAVLPIGGPGPAISPLEQGKMLFELTGKTQRFRRFPVAVLDLVIGILALAATVSKRAAAKAEYARIGRYYATKSMLVFDPETDRYSAEATPETGSDTLLDHYRVELARQVD